MPGPIARDCRRVGVGVRPRSGHGQRRRIGARRHFPGRVQVNVLVRVMVKQCREPTLQAGSDEIGVGVMVDGNHGRLLEQNGLGLLKQFVPLLRVGTLARLGQQVVVGFVCPTGLVIAPVGKEHVEKGVGVHVITDPGVAAHLVIQGALIIDVDLPFLVLQFDVDVQIPFPHFLDGLGHGAMTLQRVEHNVERGKAAAEAVQEMWKRDLNINVELENQEWKVYIDNQRTLNYQVGRYAWIGDYVDPNSFLDMFLSNGGNNQTGWTNKTYDHLLAEAGQSADPQKRYELFQKAEAILLEEAPMIPIYHYTHPYLIRPSLQGWFPTLLDHHPYKYVYLDPAREVSPRADPPTLAMP